MQTISYFIIGLTILIVLIIVLYNSYVITLSSKNIFPGSGKPVSMIQSILSAIQANSQYLFGFFIVSMFLVLVVENILDKEIAIPIITAVVGYLLGKTGKNTNIISDKEDTIKN